MADKFGIKKGQPLVLPDGTIIDKDGDGKTVIKTKAQQELEAEVEELTTDPFEDENVNTFVRTLADFNVSKAQLNPVMLILAYSVWGLDENAIARYLDIDLEQVRSVRRSDLYRDTRKEMLEAIAYAEQSSIHGYLTRKAKKAAITVANAMSNGKPDTKLKAAQDILDRSGFRPVDRVEHSHRFEDELRIVHLKEADDVDIDTGV